MLLIVILNFMNEFQLFAVLKREMSFLQYFRIDLRRLIFGKKLTDFLLHFRIVRLEWGKQIIAVVC